MGLLLRRILRLPLRERSLERRLGGVLCGHSSGRPPGLQSDGLQWASAKGWTVDAHRAFRVLGRASVPLARAHAKRITSHHCDVRPRRPTLSTR